MSVPWNLNVKKLTLPTGTGSHADQVLWPALATYGTPAHPAPYFSQTDEYIEFRCPATGPTTPGSEHTRCELRDLRSFPYDTPIHKADPLNVQFTNIEKGGKVVWTQFHDDAEPLFMADYQDGTIEAYWRAEDEAPHKSHVMLTGVALGDVMTSQLIYMERQIEFQITHNGHKYFFGIPMNRSGKNGLIYAKAGIYYTEYVDPKAVAWVRHLRVAP